MPRRKLEQRNFGEHLIGVPQSLTQDFDEAMPSEWVSFKGRENVTPVQNRYGACGLRNSICRSLFPIQNRTLKAGCHAIVTGKASPARPELLGGARNGTKECRRAASRRPL
jgi:hypothetical protein